MATFTRLGRLEFGLILIGLKDFADKLMKIKSFLPFGSIRARGFRDVDFMRAVPESLWSDSITCDASTDDRTKAFPRD